MSFIETAPVCSLRVETFFLSSFSSHFDSHDTRWPYFVQENEIGVSMSLSHKYKVHVVHVAVGWFCIFIFVPCLLFLHFISFLVDFSILRVPSICQPCSFYDFICCHCHRTIVLTQFLLPFSLSEHTIVLFFFNVVLCLFFFFRLWPHFTFQRTFAAKQKRESHTRGVACSWWDSRWQDSCTRAALHCFPLANAHGRFA